MREGAAPLLDLPEQPKEGVTELTNRTRARQIIVRMSDAEYDAYQKQVDKSRLTKNEFAIRAMLDKPINVIEDAPDILRQLKGIGNNLNQLTRAANAGTALPMTSIAILDREVMELWQWLKQARAEKA